jgi:hypothetical protein
MASALPQLLKAITEEDVPAVKRILSCNPALAHGAHGKQGERHTPLHAAAAMGCLPIVRELLHAGASCHAVDANFEVPLHVACRQVRCCAWWWWWWWWCCCCWAAPTHHGAAPAARDAPSPRTHTGTHCRPCLPAAPA